MEGSLGIMAITHRQTIRRVQKITSIVFAIKPLLSVNFNVLHAQFAPMGTWGVIFKELKLLKGDLITSFRGYDINKLPQVKPRGFYSLLI
jgi:colanic acid/amylovoran biosynthesis glycosyltransferase